MVMPMSWLKQVSSLKQMSWLKQRPGRKPRSARNCHRRDRVAPVVEALDGRVMLSVTASFAEGTLKVTGDDQDNVITISRNAGGTILVNNGAVPLQGGTATIANTNHFHIVGGAGNDNISLDSDATLDGKVAFDDLVMLAQNFQRPAPAIDLRSPANGTVLVAVPEATNPVAASFQPRSARPHAKAPAKHHPFGTF
jgi:hypothetical protein